MEKSGRDALGPSIAEIIEEPTRISGLEPEMVPALLAELLAVQSALVARLFTSKRSPQEAVQDEVLTVQEAGKMLRLKPAYLPQTTQWVRGCDFNVATIDREWERLSIEEGQIRIPALSMTHGQPVTGRRRAHLSRRPNVRVAHAAGHHQYRYRALDHFCHVIK